MSECALTAKRCVPCEGGVPKLSSPEIARLVAQVDGWRAEGDRLHKTFQFRDFRHAMRWVNRVADVAEDEGHHPDIAIHYNRVDVTLWTHAIGGLSENDFILAAKIDAVPTA